MHTYTIIFSNDKSYLKSDTCSFRENLYKNNDYIIYVYRFHIYVKNNNMYSTL